MIMTVTSSRRVIAASADLCEQGRWVEANALPQLLRRDEPDH